MALFAFFGRRAGVVVPGSVLMMLCISFLAINQETAMFTLKVRFHGAIWTLPSAVVPSDRRRFFGIVSAPRAIKLPWWWGTMAVWRSSRSRWPCCRFKVFSDPRMSWWRGTNSPRRGTSSWRKGSPRRRIVSSERWGTSSWRR